MLLMDDLQVKVISSNKDHDDSLLNTPANAWIHYKEIKVWYSSNGHKTFPVPAQPAVYFINGLYSLSFTVWPLLRFKGRKIISVRGMLHPGALSQKSLKKKLYLNILKALVRWQKADFHATTAKEKMFIEKHFGKKPKIWVIPNVPQVLPSRPVLHKEKGQLIISTVALVSPMKNHLLVLQALAAVNASVDYFIYGPIKQTDYWDTCKAVIQILPTNIKVHYKGGITPANVPNALERCHVYIQPSKSENFGHSLFEALSTGRPVITSAYTPWNHLQENKAGYNVSTNDTKSISNALQIFADMDENTLQQYSLAANEYALAAINIGGLKEQYLEMFSGISKN
jgi:glycosyltransferase involved in cell wall biosynthesis